jgi:hypothetical protein
MQERRYFTSEGPPFSSHEKRLPMTRTKRPQIRWNEERIAFLKDNYPALTVRELTQRFNQHFRVDVTEAAIGYQLHVHRVLKLSAPANGKPSSGVQLAT